MLQRTSSKDSPAKSIHFTDLVLAVRFFFFAIILFATSAFGSVREPIVVSKAQVNELRQAFAEKYGGEPDSKQTQALIQQEVDDELLFREARYVGLDRRKGVSKSSPLFKRLMIQRMRILLGRTDEEEIVGENEIHAYYKRHRERFLTSRTVTFEQVFLASDKGKADLNTSNIARASKILHLLRSGKVAPKDLARLSDPFPLGLEFHSVSPALLSRRFGARFSKAVFMLPEKRWSEPLVSSLGVHLVRIDGRSKENAAPLESVRASIVQAISREHELKRVNLGMSHLRQLYSIRFE